MSENALHALLAPVPPELFLEHYWERKPLHIRGTPDKFRGLFDRSALERALTRQHERGISVRVSFDNERDEKSVGLHLPIDASQMGEYLARGATVCVDPLDRGAPELAAYAATLKRQLHHAGAVNVRAYLSTHGFGFNTHFDRNIATTLQLEGRKRWRFSEQPGVAFPLYNALLDPSGEVRYPGRRPGALEPWEQVEADEDSFTEVILEPGDVLCLPAGTWHSAKAIGHSLALNVSFSPLPFLELLQGAVGPLLAHEQEWRRSLPAPPLDCEPGAAPPEMLRFCSERLEELRQVLEQGQYEAGPLVRAWWEAIQGTAGGETAAPAFLQLRRLQEERKAAPRPGRSTRAEPPAGRPPRDEAPPPSSASEPSPLAYDGTATCTFRVRSLEAAIDWYQKLLGFRLRYRVDAFGWCELATATEGLSLGLSQGSMEHPGGAALTLGIQDLDGARRHLESLGVRFDGPTQVIQGFVKLAAFQDPDGNRLLLSETAQPR
ncbi:MAG TPA: cupin domain-containing protein [Archangium sp.]|nr:cupin domain-containing protein [Archangium sp.]